MDYELKFRQPPEQDEQLFAMVNEFADQPDLYFDSLDRVTRLMSEASMIPAAYFELGETTASHSHRTVYEKFGL